MTLTEADLIESTAQANGFSKNKATDTIESLLEIMKRALESGEDVLISGFGKFCVNEKGERRGRNAATDSDMTLRSRNVMTFKCSGKWRDRINGDF